MMNTIGKIAWEVGKALGKAVIAGVGLELAKVASDRVRKRFGTKKDERDDVPLTPEEELRRAKAENAELRAELEKTKAGASKVPDEAQIITDDI